MGKKILVIIIIILLIIIAFGSGLYFAGAFEERGLVKLLVGGTDVKGNFMSDEEKQLVVECTDPNCLFDNFNKDCEKSFGEILIPKQEMLVYVEIAGKTDDKCIMNARLLDANGQAEYAIGLEATCFIAPEEIDTLEENFNLNDFNCEGALYEAAKIAS